MKGCYVNVGLENLQHWFHDVEPWMQKPGQ